MGVHAPLSLNEEDSVFNGALSRVTHTIRFDESPNNVMNRCCVCAYVCMYVCVHKGLPLHEQYGVRQA